MSLLQFFHGTYLTLQGLFKPFMSCIICVNRSMKLEHRIRILGGLQMETLFIADDEKNIRDGLK